MTKKIFFVLFLMIIFANPVYAGPSKEPSQDLFFEGPSDLVWEADELEIGKRTLCALSVHYRGKEITQALVKIFLDGVNITSFPVVFEKEGKESGRFSFRAEREGKHYLEFIILFPGEFQDSDTKNNRMAISFRVPGPVPLAQSTIEQPVEMKKAPVEEPQAEESEESKEEVVEIPETPVFHNSLVQTLPNSISSEEKPELTTGNIKGNVVIQEKHVAQDPLQEILNIEEGNQGYEQADALAYLGQERPLSEEPATPENAVITQGKPLIDLFFTSPSSFRINESGSRGGRALSWVLSLESFGEGEGEIEVVVADGSKHLVTQRIWIRGGETVRLPMQATFDRGGPHRLTAMINTLNNVVDRNLQNNIIEETVNIS